VTTSLADESGILAELRDMAERGRYREVLDRLRALAPEQVEGRTAFALLAAEAAGRLGDHLEARRWAAAALTVAERRAERSAGLRALNALGIIALRSGDATEAEQRFAEALETARALQDHAMQARCLNNLGVLATLRGDPAGALPNYQLALAAYQQAGNVRGIAETYHNIGIGWRERGDLRQALAAAEEAVRLAAQVQDGSLVGLALMGRAEIHLAMGDPDLASVELARAADAHARVRFDAGLPEVWRVQAAVAARRGDFPEARRLLERAAELATRQASAEALAAIERDLGAALEAEGDAVAAKAARQRALVLYRKLGASKAAAELTALVSG